MYGSQTYLDIKVSAVTTDFDVNKTMYSFIDIFQRFSLPNKSCVYVNPYPKKKMLFRSGVPTLSEHDSCV